jgi:hypothetical protein
MAPVARRLTLRRNPQQVQLIHVFEGELLARLGQVWVEKEKDDMARKDLKNAIAEKFLAGEGLEVAQRILEAMIDDEIKAPTTDHDTLESLYALRRDLHKLEESE